MKWFITLALFIACIAPSSHADDPAEPQYLVLSISLGNVQADDYSNGLVFMSLYFDLYDDEAQLNRFPPCIEPVYAEVSTIIFPGSDWNYLPGQSGYQSKMITERYRRGDADFEALLVAYHTIGPWYDIRIDTPFLRNFRMSVWSHSSPFITNGDEVLSRDPSMYYALTGYYQISGSVRNESTQSGSLPRTIRADEPSPDVFVLDIDFVDSIPNEECEADINGDGVINYFDILEFFESYQVGCP